MLLRRAPFPQVFRLVRSTLEPLHRSGLALAGLVAVATCLSLLRLVTFLVVVIRPQLPVHHLPWVTPPPAPAQVLVGLWTQGRLTLLANPQAPAVLPQAQAGVGLWTLGGLTCPAAPAACPALGTS